MVGQHVGAQAGDPAVTGSRQLGGHMIVAREGRGREVLHAVLYPLHRHTQHDRADDGADVAWIDRTSVVEGTSVSVRVELGGRRIIKKKTKKTTEQQQKKK